jgi:ATP/maltotriose-dependent transcriptional regulator MalT
VGLLTSAERSLLEVAAVFTDGWTIAAAGQRRAGRPAGRPGSERVLLDLEDANAFVESTGPGRAWFRYHHLFGDLLPLELRRRLPAEVPLLHRRAAEWFIRHGQVAEAVGHTQAAADWPDAARLLAAGRPR